MVFRWVWEVKREREMETFLVTVRKADEFVEMQDPDWVCDLAFGTHSEPSERPQSEVAGDECVCV